jgi:hypothetical protein
MSAATAQVHGSRRHLTRHPLWQDTDDAALVANSLRQQVVVPFAVGVGAKERRLAMFPDYTDVALLPGAGLDCVELIRFIVNPHNGILASDPPLLREISDVRDMFVGTFTVRFVDTGYVIFGHKFY